MLRNLSTVSLNRCRLPGLATRQRFLSVLEGAVIHRHGDDGYGSRMYVLLPQGATLEHYRAEPRLELASIRAHKNVVFAAQQSPKLESTLEESCLSLLDKALEDASKVGEQPQAIASLKGLSEWVASCIQAGDNPVVEAIRSKDSVGFGAIQAMATGVPREGHSVVGAGTFRDGHDAWEQLAREYIRLRLSDESNLYQSRNGELVVIEHLADRSEAYLETAGGAMARFFFL